MVSYPEFLNMSMTYTECKELFTSDLIVIMILTLIAAIVCGIGLIYLAKQNRNMSTFIKDSKLEEQFQQHKNKNKGLN